MDEKISSDNKKPLLDTEESALIPTATAEDKTFVFSEETQVAEADVEDCSVTQNSETSSQLKIVMEDMIQHLLQNDQDIHMVSGIEKFVKRYQNMCTSSTTAKLASALHQFAWSPEKKLSIQPGLLRRGTESLYRQLLQVAAEEGHPGVKEQLHQEDP